MKKPNVSLKFAAAAISASRKARRASTKTVRAYFQKKAQQYLMKAAVAKDAGHALRIIAASNKAAIKASTKSKARSLRADFEDDMIVDDIDMIDDSIDMEDDVILGEAEDDAEDSEEADAEDDAEDSEEVDAEDEADEEDDAKEDDSEDEVDARLASILARARARRRTMARLKAKRQNRR